LCSKIVILKKTKCENVIGQHERIVNDVKISPEKSLNGRVTVTSLENLLSRNHTSNIALGILLYQPVRKRYLLFVNKNITFLKDHATKHNSVYAKKNYGKKTTNN